MRISDWSSDVCSSDLLDFAQDGIGAERLGQFRRRAKAFRQRVAIIAGDKEERHGPVLEQFGDGVTMFTIEIDVEQGDVDVVIARRCQSQSQIAERTQYRRIFSLERPRELRRNDRKSGG